MINTTKEKKVLPVFPYFGERSISLSHVHGITTRGQSKPQSKTDTQDRQYVERVYTKKTWFSRVVLELLESRLASADNSMELSADLFSPYASERLLSCS